ncbi:hypothetical protein [Chryseobacterium sp. MP_3.2]|uniref:hypothetical protein n=1 Tax=Chryseobacterium sp. MP_3.2 TaxID=3071712 RepID=UPI002E0290A8|nr:hypothetical protein [Chryseobacterium sp. MP_3.2]
MKTNNKYIALIILLLVGITSCTPDKKEEISDLQIVRNNNNQKSYPTTKMDSAQVISLITKQKIQELFDLSTLYTSGNRDTEIDSVIYAQMRSYFAESDSNKLKPLLKQLDSFKVRSAKVGNVNVKKEIIGNDTLDLAQYIVEYFDQRDNMIGKFDKNAKFMLKLSPVKFKKEFRFYFVDLDFEIPKDSVAVGVIK